MMLVMIVTIIQEKSLPINMEACGTRLIRIMGKVTIVD
jgi:hypothetical protein